MLGPSDSGDRGQLATESGKLAGKTEWAVRRRPATRRAGFNATSLVQLAQERLDGCRLEVGTSWSTNSRFQPRRMTLGWATEVGSPPTKASAWISILVVALRPDVLEQQT
jgi:hypothetical protein